MSRLENLKNLLRAQRALKNARFDAKLYGKSFNPNANLRDYIYRPGVYGFSGVPEARALAQRSENARIDRAVFDTPRSEETGILKNTKS
jgi:hypothetical protein